MKVGAKPFLKWVGGKTQLLYDLESRLPDSIKNTGVVKRYIEPFVGERGYSFFGVVIKLRRFFLFDINKRLVLSYKELK